MEWTLDNSTFGLGFSSHLIIRKYVHKSFRYIDAYRKGLTLNAAEYAVKKY